MQVSIYKPTKSAMQSGNANTHTWILEFPPNGTRDIEPIMGWISSSDTLREVKLKFPSKEAAIAYAEKNNLAYELHEPNNKKIIKRPYANNFL